MTDGIRKAMREMTGSYIPGCPWRALRDPLVHRVFAAMSFFESGQLAFAVPNPSHRIVSALRHYHTVSNRLFSKQMELDRAERERDTQINIRRGGR